MKQIYLIIVLFIFPLNGKSNIYSPTFKNINIENGLSNSTVRSIAKDADGFMWFGTYDGLCRYDGINMKVFRKITNDSNSINHNHISCLFCDSKQQLYVGTHQGINVYSPKDEVFKSIIYSEFDTKKQCKLTSEINFIVEDNNNNLFVGSLQDGLIRLNNKKNEFEQIKIINKNHEISVRSIALAPNNEIFLGVGRQGIVKFNTITNKVTFINNEIRSFNCMQYLNGILYIGNSKGLFALSLTTNKLTQLQTIPQLSSTIQFIKVDSNKVLWVGTETNGIVLIDTKNNSTQCISSGYENSLLTSVGVYCLFKDNNNITWIGTMRGGVEMWDPKQNLMFSRRQNQNSTPSANMITCLLEIKSNNIWLGTDGGGLHAYNLSNDKFERNSTLDAINKIAGNAVISMVKDKSGNVWLGTYGHGLIRYNQQTNRIEQYVKDNSKLKSNNIWSLYIDKQDNLWVGAVSNGGLFKFNYKTNLFEYHNVNVDNVLFITESINKKILIGNYSGITVYEPETQKCMMLHTDAQVRSICQDKRGTIWIGTQGYGIMTLDLKNGDLKLVQNNLAYLKQSSIMAIVEDESQNLWISTTKGLFRYHYPTDELTTYDKKDGLQSVQFNYSAVLKTSDKKLFFGGINGFTFFDPLTLKSNKEKCPLRLIDFSIFNKSVYTDKIRYARIIDQLAKKEMNLNYNEAFFRIDFTAISFDNPEKTQYKYMLEGLDKNWNYTGTIHQASYSGLEPGKYIFKVKYSTQPGHWSNETFEMRIQIQPPFYQTWWAYLFYLLIIACVIYLIIQVQNRQNKLKQDLVLADLKEEQIKQNQQVREQFFINVSHELRTPLTLIIPPLKDNLTNEPFIPLNKFEIQSVYNNANRLLLLINKLLLFRKSELEKNQLQISKNDIISFAGSICENFSQIAKKKDIQFTFDAPESPLLFMFDREKMEIILYNLLSNAFKYTPEGGKIELKIALSNDHSLVFNVSDNGAGIDKLDLDNIFTQFYSSNKYDGIGIGLSLVKSYVELMHGVLQIESEKDKGSNFTINFDLNANYKSTEIIANNTMTNISSDKINELVGLDTDIYNEQINVSGEVKVSSNLLKILIVDDNPEILNYIYKILSSTGLYEISQATDGKSALKMAKVNFPDIIISDVHMPLMNGLELCRAIKENIETNHIYFILITADVFEATENKGLNYGADEFITKPFDKIKLLNKIKTVYNYQQIIRKYFQNSIILGKNNNDSNSINTKFVDECIALIKTNYNSDDFSPQKFSELMNMSRFTLYKKIKLCAGVSINELIRTVKMSIAAELIIEGKLSISEIGNEIGFYDPRYFRDCFKKQFGVLPSEYKAQHLD